MNLLRGDAAPPPSNATYVAGLLRDLLTRGQLEPGSRIKEADVADELGLSRGPVREAFRVLEEDGLIDLLPNRGAVVRRYTALEILEVYALRSRLGSLALHCLVHREEQDLEARLGAYIDELGEAAQRGDEARVLELDLDFQDALIAAAELPYTTQIFRRLTMRLRMFVAVLGTRYDDYLDVIVTENRDLLDAVLTGDTTVTDRVWRTRLRGWVENFIDKLPDEDFDAELWVRLASDDAPTAEGSSVS